jgi:hypothetical protein
MSETATVPRVVNIKREGIPEGAVYCGRAAFWNGQRLPESPYRNPFVIGRHGDRDQCCDRFERERLPYLVVSPLKGKTLVCWCAPLRCHCDVILRKANPELFDEPRSGPFGGEAA